MVFVCSKQSWNTHAPSCYVCVCLFDWRPGWLVKLARLLRWPHPWQRLNVPFFFCSWMVKRDRYRERERKTASSLKEILCNSKQIVILGVGRKVMSCSKHDLSLSRWVWEKGEMRFNLARTVALVRWYTGIIKCEGIKLQMAPFVWEHIIPLIGVCQHCWRWLEETPIMDKI